MNYQLFFDTSDRTKVTVRLLNGNKIIAEVSRSQKLTSQALLPLIKEILKNNKIDPQDISGVSMNLGPGSYTGLKVGAAVANAFGWFLKIPVNGKNKITNPRFE